MSRGGSATSPDFGRNLIDACERFTDRTALIDSHETLHFRDLAAASGGLATGTKLKRLSIGEPVLVAVCGRASDMVGFLGVWRAGGVVVPIHRGAVTATVHELIRLTGARYFVDPSSEAVAIPGLTGAPPVLETGQNMPAPDPMLKGAAWIIFTSGSTGEPKGVIHGHDTWAAKLEMIDGEIGSSETERTILVLQPNFIFGQWVACLTLIRGGTLIVRDRFDAATVLADLAGRATRIAVVPTMLRRLKAKIGNGAAPAFTGTILSGGEPLPVDVVAWLRSIWPEAKLWDLYGTTETCACDFFVRPGEWEQSAGTIGNAGPRIDFRIEPGTGELHIRSPFVMRGYHRDPFGTRVAFADGYFRTGDIARRRSDGRVELIGRMTDIINRGGIKIAPLEIERVFSEHPDIVATLVTGVPDPVRGEAVHVFVVPRAGGGLDAENLIAWARAKLDRSKVPDRIHFGDELPTGRTGKADRSALRSLILAQY